MIIIIITIVIIIIIIMILVITSVQNWPARLRRMGWTELVQ